MPNLLYDNYVEAILLYFSGQNEMGANKTKAFRNNQGIHFGVAESDKNEKICLVGFADVGAVFEKMPPFLWLVPMPKIFSPFLFFTFFKLF